MPNKEKQLRVAKLYCEEKKTLRQCAELMEVDLENMIDILRDLNIPLEVDSSPQHKQTLKMLRLIRKSHTRRSNNFSPTGR